jgi:uncharacterized protein (DUF58 family)
MPAQRTFLSPEAVARLKGLQLRARHIASGVLSGMHRSAYHGYSVEFAEHRQYVPGDDIRHIDWRLFGRQERLYIKQYEEETNLTVYLLVDTSKSMGYQSGALSKYDYACCIAATFAWLLVHQQDTVGLLTFADEVGTHLPSAAGQTQLHNLIQILEQQALSGTTEITALLARTLAEVRRRSLIVLFSDLLVDGDELRRSIEQLAHTGHELVVMHVLDDEEWHFNFTENIRFDGLEEDQHVLEDAQSLRNSYLDALDRFVLKTREACLQQRADYVPVNTSEPLDRVLSGYLVRRMHRLSRGLR